MTVDIRRMIQLYGTSGEWVASTQIPYAGEVCAEYVAEGDIRVKIGDGVRLFPALPYSNVTLFSGGGGSTFVPSPGDYNADMIDDTPSHVMMAQTERDKLIALDIARQLPEGGTSGQRLARSNASPHTYGWVDPATGGGASRTTELLDYAITAPVDGQVAVFRTSNGKYNPENPASAALARVKKTPRVVAGKMGGLNRLFVAGDEEAVTIMDVAGGPIHLQFDNSVSHATNELIAASFICVNYNATDDFRLYFESAVALTATVPVLAQNAVGVMSTGVVGTQLTAGANALSVTVAAGSDISIMLVYAANPADTTQVTRSTGFERTIAGGAAVTVPWTDTRANVINDKAAHISTYEVVLGTLASPVVYTFKPIWLDAALVPTLSGNVNAYVLFCYVFTGSDQTQPFEGQHPDNTLTPATSVLSKVYTDGPQRLAVHNVFKRNNNTNTAITVSAGFTSSVEGTTNASANDSNLRYISARQTVVSEGVSAATFTLPNSAEWGYAPFAVRPSVMAGMVVHVNGNKPAYIADENILATVLYDKNNRIVNVSY